MLPSSGQGVPLGLPERLREVLQVSLTDRLYQEACRLLAHSGVGPFGPFRTGHLLRPDEQGPLRAGGSREEQELVIPEALGCSLPDRNAPGELPCFGVATRALSCPSFQMPLLFLPGWSGRWYQSICRGLFFVASLGVGPFVPPSGF